MNDLDKVTAGSKDYENSLLKEIDDLKKELNNPSNSLEERKQIYYKIEDLEAKLQDYNDNKSFHF